MAALDSIDAVILAGGLGTRLRPALPDTQKVMAPVAGAPFLARLVAQITSAGGRRIVLALGHRAPDVTRWIERTDLPAELIASFEPAPLGTGGALRHALPHILSKTVVVMNGDSFAAADLGALTAFHHERAAAITLLLAPVEDTARYGTVALAEDGQVRAFREKDAARAGPAPVNAGIYVFARSVIEAIPQDRSVSLEKEVFPDYCGRGLYAQRQDVPFLDIGTAEHWRAADRFFASLGAELGGK